MNAQKTASAALVPAENGIITANAGNYCEAEPAKSRNAAMDSALKRKLSKMSLLKNASSGAMAGSAWMFGATGQSADAMAAIPLLR